MANNQTYKLVEHPQEWVGLRDAVRFTWQPPSVVNALVNLGGFVFTNNSPSFGQATPKAGDLIYIESGIYKGFHNIREVIVGGFTLNTFWTANDLSAQVRYAQSNAWEIWKCDNSTHAFVLKIGDVKPYLNFENNMTVDVASFLNLLFRAVPPNQNDSVFVDNNLFAKYAIRIINGSNHYDSPVFSVAYSALKTEELNRDFVYTGRPLRSSNVNMSNVTWWESFIVKTDGIPKIITYTRDGCEESCVTIEEVLACFCEE